MERLVRAREVETLRHRSLPISNQAQQSAQQLG